MAIDFKPKTEKEIEEEMIFPAGDYDFDVLTAEDTVSKSSGNSMIKIKLGVYVGSQIRRIDDYLLPAMSAKLRHFCDTTGLLSKYEAGTLEAADCLGRAGRVKIAVDPAKEAYPAKNVVKDYVCRPAKPLSEKKESKVGFGEGEDAPF